MWISIHLPAEVGAGLTMLHIRRASYGGGRTLKSDYVLVTWQASKDGRWARKADSSGSLCIKFAALY